MITNPNDSKTQLQKIKENVLQIIYDIKYYSQYPFLKVGEKKRGKIVKATNFKNVEKSAQAMLKAIEKMEEEVDNYERQLNAIPQFAKSAMLVQNIPIAIHTLEDNFNVLLMSDIIHITNALTDQFDYVLVIHDEDDFCPDGHGVAFGKHKKDLYDLAEELDLTDFEVKKIIEDEENQSQS